EDWVGAFAVSVHGAEERAARFRADADDYSAILLTTLADRLAEALAERLHQRVRTELWRYAPDEARTAEDPVPERYRGTRPARGPVPGGRPRLLRDTPHDARRPARGGSRRAPAPARPHGAVGLRAGRGPHDRGPGRRTLPRDPARPRLPRLPRPPHEARRLRVAGRHGRDGDPPHRGSRDDAGLGRRRPLPGAPRRALLRRGTRGPRPGRGPGRPQRHERGRGRGVARSQPGVRAGGRGGLRPPAGGRGGPGGGARHGGPVAADTAQSSSPPSHSPMPTLMGMK